MRLDGEYVFAARIQDVWDALFDPAVLAAVLPGCEKLDLVDGAYVGEMKVKVGPIQGTFTGKVNLLDQEPPTSYRMTIDGRGPQGFVQANATIRLEAIGDAETRMRYESEAQIGGKIATVGQRLVETSARAIVKQSLEGLHENIKIRAAAHRAPVASETPAATDAAAATDAGPVGAAPPPVIEYKRADAGQLASGVAKAVLRSLAPYLIAAALGIGVVIYFLVR